MSTSSLPRLDPHNIFGHPPLPVLAREVPSAASGAVQLSSIEADPVIYNRRVNAALGSYGQHTLKVVPLTWGQAAPSWPKQTGQTVTSAWNATMKTGNYFGLYLRSFFSEKIAAIHRDAATRSRRLVAMNDSVKFHNAKHHEDIASIFDTHRRIREDYCTYSDMVEAPAAFDRAYAVLEDRLRIFTFDVFSRRDGLRLAQQKKSDSGSLDPFSPSDDRAPYLLAAVLVNPHVLKAPNFLETLSTLELIFPAEVFPFQGQFAEARERFLEGAPTFFPTPYQWESKLLDATWATEGRCTSADLAQRALQGLAGPNITQTLHYVLQSSNQRQGAGRTAADSPLIRAITSVLPAVGILSSALDLFGSLLGETTSARELRKTKAVFNVIKENSLQKVNRADQRFRDEVRNLDQQIDRSLAESQVGQARTLIYRRQTLFLCLPDRPLWIGFPTEENLTDHQRQRATDLNERVKSFLQSYPDPQLERLVDHLRVDSIDKEPARRKQIYLHGASGTGKSYFVAQLAQTLGLPLKSLHLDDLTEHFDHAKFADRLSMLTDASKTNESLLGAVATANFESGYQNNLIFIDEVGGSLGMSGLSSHSYHSRIDNLKVILDRDQPKRLIPLCQNLKISLDGARPIVILAGNEPIYDPALRARFDVIEFPSVTRDMKRKIFNEKIDDWSQKYDGKASPRLVKLAQEAGRSLVERLLDAGQNEAGVKTALSHIDLMKTSFLAHLIHGKFINDGLLEKTAATFG